MENKNAELNTLHNDFDDKDARYILTPWGCMSCILSDYNIDYSHITPIMGKHMVEDFMELMEKTGYLEKVDTDESINIKRT